MQIGWKQIRSDASKHQGKQMYNTSGADIAHDVAINCSFFNIMAKGRNHCQNFSAIRIIVI